jgi:D-aminoacyl-tRNA deacylase
MKFAILYSKKDPAGVNIAEQLKNHFIPQAQIIELSKDTIYSEQIDEKEERLKNMDFIIFATRHKSSNPGKTLSIHAPGNWRNADFGGKDSKLSMTSALALKYLFQKLNENAFSLPEYRVTLECTHHGPLILTKPCLFIEIGAGEAEWKDKKAGEIIAKTIADFQDFEKWKTEENNKNIKVAIGVGSPHYAPNFTKIQASKESNIAISHIIPEYHLPLNESMILEAIKKTIEHTDLILVDWKGCGNSESRQEVIKIIEKLGLAHERAERIEKD